MHLSSTVTITKALSDIEVKPLTAVEQEQILKNSFEYLADEATFDFANFLQRLTPIISNYLKEYKTNWQLFENSFNLVNTINARTKDSNLTSTYMRLRNQRGSEVAAQNFIRTLEKGNLLLNYIRQVLTTQSIDTNFTIKGENGEIYYTEKHNVRYNLVLSTFGSSGNNFVSLAYKVDVEQTIQDLKSSIEGKSANITQEDIYMRIMTVKLEYLKELEMRNKRKYPPRYDSKDAEIFDLMQQRLKNNDIISLNKALTKATYQKMRKAMGGRGGYRTSSTQLGDVGLIQDKLVSQKENQVNFARQTLIYNRFLQMEQALLSQDKIIIKNTFLKIFTEQQSRVGDNISKAANREAVKHIKELFSTI